MMDFFDKLGATITTKSKDVVQKTKDIAEIVKLNGQIANEEDAVRNAYLQIGKWYLLSHEGELPCEAAQWAQAIRQAQEKIERCQEQIFKLKGLQACPGCCAQVDADALYCPRCGTKLPEKPEPCCCEESAAQEESCSCGCEQPAEDPCCEAEEPQCCCEDSRQPDAEPEKE
ncbi:MAG: hypothetical protein ACLRVT_01070 [Oscillospiraceae bacterium]